MPQHSGENLILSDPVTAEEVSTQLDRLLTSAQFRASRRCQGLLRTVTERTLAGDITAVKERMLGMSVFGRPAEYDTSQDPIVRVTAAEVRKKLAQYYQEPVHHSELRIELLPGGYVPEFRRVLAETGVVPDRQAPALNPPVPVEHPVDSRLRWYAAILVVIAAGLTVFFVSRVTWKDQATERFWAPVLKSPGDILICLGQPVVYNLRSTEEQDRIQSMTDHSATPSPNPGQDLIPLSHLVVFWDRYVALGDAVCMARITGLLERHGKRFRARGEGATSFTDLRETPAILIGAFDNRWTLSAASNLRFTFTKDSSQETDMVRDRDHPDRKDWKLKSAWPYWDVENDYAIVSRILDVTTGRPVVIAAGITQFGTMATGEFLTDPDCWSDVLPRLPRNWETKNLQIVLRVPVIHRAAGRPRVVDTYVW